MRTRRLAASLPVIPGGLDTDCRPASRASRRDLEHHAQTDRLFGARAGQIGCSHREPIHGRAIRRREISGRSNALGQNLTQTIKEIHRRRGQTRGRRLNPVARLFHAQITFHGDNTTEIPTSPTACWRLGTRAARLPKN